jgi:hypothetical protein
VVRLLRMLRPLTLNVSCRTITRCARDSASTLTR